MEVMDNGKIIDVEITQRYSKPCQQHKDEDDLYGSYEVHKQNYAVDEGSFDVRKHCSANDKQTNRIVKTIYW